MRGNGREYYPFLSIDDVVRCGHGDLLYRDGEERKTEKNKFIPTEEIHVTSKLHPDFLDQFDNPDPLQILLMKEGGNWDYEDDTAKEKVLLVSDDLSTFISKDTNVVHVMPTLKRDDFILSYPNLVPYEFKEIPEEVTLPKFLSMSPGRIPEHNWFTRGFSHGERGRKPVLRKHKRQTKNRRHIISKEVREIIMA
jgi:hypothetical protein